ncbi:MAG: hypothetical protein DRR08_24225 [Candidatus Parabeggiatoa sp. nov. 2]|nr:MAG: hypothetical protein B6247_12445 [Beggiatoa sp. 4572_84]RKZ55489.1 MAG: hypothetical protein DRR08_24225 [Gammaproteobacteria bacterium]
MITDLSLIIDLSLISDEIKKFPTNKYHFKSALINSINDSLGTPSFSTKAIIKISYSVNIVLTGEIRLKEVVWLSKLYCKPLGFF